MQLLYIFGIDLDIPWWILLLVILIFSYYKYMTWHFGLFKELGIPGPKPYPILGNLHTFMKDHWQVRDHNMLGNNRAVGWFMGRAPMLTVNDVSFAKQVTVKKFNNFVDRNDWEVGTKPLNRAVSALRGEEWRVVRNTLTPTFSAGKMKRMNNKMNACADQLVENIENSLNKDEPFDFKELTGAYTMDVIARTSFGLEINSQKDEHCKFVKMAKIIATQGLKNPLLILIFFFPFALKFITYIGLVPSMPRKPTNFFLDVLEQTLSATKENKETASDFMQLMAEAHKEETKEEHMEEENKEVLCQDKHKKKSLTKDDILGNSLIFFLAGYETTANTLSFVGYSLANNPESQDKLIDEIDRVLGDKLPTYEVLIEMPYLDQVIHETMRLYPQAPMLTRYAKEDITIEGIFIPKGVTVAIPAYVFHTDPDVWPEPLKFDPERFSPKEKAKRDPYYWLGFGTGPRNCIGQRLAVMEMKIAIIKILQKYKIVTCDKTENPLIIENLRAKAKNGMFLKAERRKVEE